LQENFNVWIGEKHKIIDVPFPPALYLVIIGLSGLLLVLWLRRSINLTEYIRKKRIKKRKPSESAKTETPLDKPEIDAKEIFRL